MKSFDSRGLLRFLKDYSLVIILAVLLAGFLGRGVVRSSILPNGAKLAYGHELTSLLSLEREQLQNTYPFGQIKYISETPTNCRLIDAHWLKTEVTCSNYLFRGQVSTKGMSAETFQARIQGFEQSLGKNGWTKTADYSQFPSKEPAYGWWYSTTFEKKAKGNTCSLSIERDKDLTSLDNYLGCSHDVELL